jgi:hypothetical protein
MKNHFLVHWHSFWTALKHTSWGSWLGAVALVVGLGAFLDEHYVGEGIREAVRQRLVKWLERLNYPRTILNLFVSEIKKGALLALLGLAPAILCVLDYALWRRGYHVTMIMILSLEVLLITPVFLLAAIPLLPFGLVLLGRLFYVAALLTFILVKMLIFIVFRPAADPKRSPFKFATGMIGLWILAAKFALELSK